jgi:hypothetical protein
MTEGVNANYTPHLEKFQARLKADLKDILNTSKKTENASCLSSVISFFSDYEHRTNVEGACIDLKDLINQMDKFIELSKKNNIHPAIK